MQQTPRGVPAMPEAKPDWLTTTDSVYDAFSQPPAVDISTRNRQITYHPAQEGGSGTYAVALNGKKTTFRFSSHSGDRVRWDTCALAIRLGFSSSETAAANVDCTDENNRAWCSPSPFMLGELINNIQLKWNSGAQPIYIKQNGTFLPDFITRMLSTYTLDQLEQNSAIFSPIVGSSGDEVYLHPSAADAKYNLAKAQRVDGATVEASPYIVPTAAADESGSASAVTWRLASATIPAAKPAYWGAQYGSGAATERWAKYISTNSSDRPYELIVSFADLFPRMRGSPTNLRDINIMIEWNPNKGGILETSRFPGSGVATSAYVHILGAELILDTYQPVPRKIESTVGEIQAGEPDYVSFMDTDPLDVIWNGSSIIASQHKNVDSVWLFQIAKQCRNTAGGSLYSSSSQFLLGNGETDADTTYRMHADEPHAHLAGHGIQSVTFKYGGARSPAIPTAYPGTTANTKSLDLGRAYHLYLQSFERVSDRLVGPPIPWDIYSRTMPIIRWRPWGAPTAVHKTDADELLINFAGTTPPTLAENRHWWIVLMKPKYFRLEANQQVTPIETL